jgi:hypothetical protein
MQKSIHLLARYAGRRTASGVRRWLGELALLVLADGKVQTAGYR